MRSKLLSFAAPILLGPLVACGGEPDAPRMNVLLITLDTTRPDRLSCYGGAAGITPVIDGIAQDGTRFERAVSTAGITPMSHSSILTGLNNYRHGMRVFYSKEVSHRLKDEVDTLPEILGGEGYQTVARVSSYPVSEAYNLQQGFDDFETGIELESLDLERQQKHETSWDTGGLTNTQRRGDFTTDSALAWLDANGTSGPWCMWLHMFDAHDFSLVPPVDFAERFGIQYPDERDARRMPQSLEWRERMYDPELAFMDMQIGRLRDWLERNGQDENTVIVITADHGQGLADGFERHGWMKHRLLYDWSVRVPMIVRIPGEEPGRVVDTQVRTIDVVPTILEALGVPLRTAVEGESMLPLVRGGSEASPRLAYADALNLYDAHAPPAQNLPPGQKDNLFMVCDGRWKLVYHERNPAASELYDLLKNPEETQNLYGTHPEEAERLRTFLEERSAMRVEPPGPGEAAVPNADSLKGLGYSGGNEPEPAPKTGDNDEDR